MAGQDSNAWVGEVGGERYRDTVEGLVFIIGAGEPDYDGRGIVLTPQVRVTMCSPDMAPAEVFATGPERFAQGALLILAPFVGTDGAAALCVDYGREVLEPWGLENYALSGVEVYRWLEARGVLPAPPAPWCWQSDEALVERMRRDVIDALHEGTDDAAQGRNDVPEDEIPF